MSKKIKKGKRKQADPRTRKRKQGDHRKHRPGSSSQGAAKKTGDLYHVHSQAGLNSLLASGRPTLVDFWAPWCQPCLRMGPIFERIAARYGDRINFAKVDTQSLPKVGSRYGVKSIPTIIAFAGRQEAKREVGLMNEQKMKRFAERFLPEEEEEEIESDSEEISPAGYTDIEPPEVNSHNPKPKPNSGGFAERIKRFLGGKKS